MVEHTIVCNIQRPLPYQQQGWKDMQTDPTSLPLPYQQQPLPLPLSSQELGIIQALVHFKRSHTLHDQYAQCF